MTATTTVALGRKDRARVRDAYVARFGVEPRPATWAKLEEVLALYRAQRRRRPVDRLVDRIADGSDIWAELHREQAKELRATAVPTPAAGRFRVPPTLEPDGYLLGDIEGDRYQLLPVVRFGPRVDLVGAHDLHQHRRRTTDRFLAATTLWSAGIPRPLSPATRLPLRLDHPLLAHTCGLEDLPDRAG